MLSQQQINSTIFTQLRDASMSHTEPLEVWLIKWFTEMQIPPLDLMFRKIENISEEEYIDCIILMTSLRKNGQVSEEISEIEKRLFELVFQKFYNKEWDFLQTGSFTINYFIKLDVPESSVYVLELLKIFINSFQQDYNDITENIISKLSRDTYINLNISKGFCQLLIAVIEVMEVFKDDERINKCVHGITNFIDGFCQYIIQQMMPINSDWEQFSFFPSTIDVEENSFLMSNSLSWLSGDLNQVQLLYRASKLTGSQSFWDIAERIGEYTLTRRNITTTEINNPFFRNGSIGLANIYRNLFELTGNTKYREGYDFWIIETLKFIDINKESLQPLNYLDGLLGVWIGLQDIEYQRNNFLLV
jgi:lantibiotic biosynthesis protein